MVGRQDGSKLFRRPMKVCRDHLTKRQVRRVDGPTTTIVPSRGAKSMLLQGPATVRSFQARLLRSCSEHSHGYAR